MKTRFRLSFERALIASLVLGIQGIPAVAQSLWKDDTSVSMVADKKGHAVGDIVTVLIQESNVTSKDQKTQTSKKTGVDASVDSFFFSPGASGLLTKKGGLPALRFNADSSFDGGGKINNTERITARIAVRVVDVLPNGNLVIEGTRQIAFSGETQDAVLRGTIRPQDISSGNTVFSYNISDATIKFISKGTLTNSQKKGWFTRIWDKVSPF